MSAEVDLPAENADEGDEEKTTRERVERFVMIFSFVFVAFIMFDNDLRLATGDAVGLVMDPIFYFGGAHPLYTLLGAGISMIVLSTAVRHFMIDWMEMARVQNVMKEFQSELKEAQKNDNHYKVNKLTEVQPEVMKLQAKMSGGQLKPMAITMLVVIPIFAWLLQFVNDPATVSTVQMPWTDSWSLEGSFWIIPRWILLYSLFSIPFGQLTQRVLKLWEYESEIDAQPDAGGG